MPMNSNSSPPTRACAGPMLRRASSTRSTTISHPQFWRDCGHVDGVVLCFGVLTPEDQARHDWDKCQELLEINFKRQRLAVELGRGGDTFAERQRGFIGVLSSVAGRPGAARQLPLWQRQKRAFDLRRRLALPPVSQERERDDDQARPG